MLTDETDYTISISVGSVCTLFMENDGHQRLSFRRSLIPNKGASLAVPSLFVRLARRKGVVACLCRDVVQTEMF